MGFWWNSSFPAGYIAILRIEEQRKLYALVFSVLLMLSPPIQNTESVSQFLLDTKAHCFKFRSCEFSEYFWYYLYFFLSFEAINCWKSRAVKVWFWLNFWINKGSRFMQAHCLLGAPLQNTNNLQINKTSNYQTSPNSCLLSTKLLLNVGFWYLFPYRT